MMPLRFLVCLLCAGSLSSLSGQEPWAALKPLYEKIKEDNEVKRFYATYLREVSSRESLMRDRPRASLITKIACYRLANKEPDGTEWSTLLTKEFTDSIRRLQEQYQEANSTEDGLTIAEDVLFYNQLLIDLCQSQPEELAAKKMLLECSKRVFDFRGDNVEALELLAEHYASDPANQKKAIAVYRQILFHRPLLLTTVHSKLVNLLMEANQHEEVNVYNALVLDQTATLNTIRNPQFAAALKSLDEARLETKVWKAARALRGFIKEAQDFAPPDRLVFYTQLNGKAVPFNFVLVKSGDYVLGLDGDRRQLGVQESADPTFGATLKDFGKVRNPKAFYILDREVTAGQWSSVMAVEPGEDAELPKGGVSWIDAMVFCEKLPHHTGIRVRCRLPTEWEWECSARAAKEFYFPWGPDGIELPEVVQRVGDDTVDKTPSGIFHLAGNLREWCVNDADEMLIDDGGVLVIDESRYEFELHSDGAQHQLLKGGSPVEGTVMKAVKGGCAGLEAVYLQLPIRRPALAKKRRDEYGFRLVIIP